jgi:hypothetical protein
VIICSIALKTLAHLVDTTVDAEAFSIAKAIITNIERNGANKPAFHKFQLAKIGRHSSSCSRMGGGLRIDTANESPKRRSDASFASKIPSAIYLESLLQQATNDPVIDVLPIKMANSPINVGKKLSPRRNKTKYGVPSNKMRSNAARSELQFEPGKQAMTMSMSISSIKSMCNGRSSADSGSLSSLTNQEQSLEASRSMQDLRTTATSKLLAVASASGLSPPRSCKLDGKPSVVIVPNKSYLRGSSSAGNMQGDVEDMGASDSEAFVKMRQQLVSKAAGPPRLRSGPSVIEKWSLPNTWAPRVAMMERGGNGDGGKGKSVRVTLEASRMSSNNMWFGRGGASTSASWKGGHEEGKPETATPIRLAKFDHSKGSKVYDGLFNTYQGMDDVGGCHFYQTSTVPYEAVLIPYPSPSLERHGLGQRGYCWPNNGLTFQGICKDAYPGQGMDGLLNPFRSNHLPNLTCPQAMKSPTPPYHSIARSKQLFHAHHVWRDHHLEEHDSPFFGIFPDENMTLYIDVRDEFVPTVAVVESIKRPFRGEPWQLKKVSIWNERLQVSDARDFWDTPFVFAKAFEKDWSSLMDDPRINKLVTEMEKRGQVKGAQEGAETRKVKTVLLQNYETLVAVFRYYAALHGNHAGLFSMQFNSFRQFVTDSKLPEEDVPLLKAENFDQLFKLVNFEVDKSSAESKANGDREIVRMEWLEMILRVSLLKFGGGKGALGLSGCLQRFVETTIQTNLPPTILVAAAAQGNHFRDHRLYNHRVDEILKANVDGLRYIFNRFKDPHHKRGAPGSVKTMDVRDWLSLLTDLRLTELGLSQREGTAIFINSIPLVINELLEQEKAQQLAWISFLEAICRIADAIDIPDKGMMAELGVSNSIDFHAQMIETPIEIRGVISAKFNTFRETQFKETLGDQSCLHCRLEEALPLLFSRLILEGPKDKKPRYVPSKTLQYSPEEFDPVEDPPIFRRMDQRHASKFNGADSAKNEKAPN